MQTEVDLCPCGSGRDYRFCCRKKAKLFKKNEPSYLRQFQIKLSLRRRIERFLIGNMSFAKKRKLEVQLTRRVKKFGIGPLTTSLLEKNFLMGGWLLFYYVYENGKRGVEWYLDDQGHLLSKEEKQIISKWIGLKPAVIEMLSWNTEGIWYENCLSKKRFYISRAGTVTGSSPWNYIYCLLGENEDGNYTIEQGFCFNPLSLPGFLKTLKELAKETKLTLQDTLQDCYLEVISALYAAYFKTEKEKSMELNEEMVVFRMKRPDEIKSYFKRNPSWEIEPKMKDTFYWVEERYLYKDSEEPHPIEMGRVSGSIVMMDDEWLSFRSYEPAKLRAFEQFVSSTFNHSLTLFDRSFNKIRVDRLEVQGTYVAKKANETPEYFIGVARLGMNRFDPNYPIYFFKNQTLNQLIKNGNIDLAERWLREAEYDDYNALEKAYSKCAPSPDFNTLRRHLNLPLSPFVTNGNQRFTTITPI